ncbi:MAG: hypothetical protein DMG15_00780 [Acidobacteria bacterium]|nr:MAG: hypothetical protein DMG15_00780 [Acidobacteriota bacterium]
MFIIGVEVGVGFELFRQIDDAVITKRRNLVSILRVQGNKLVTRCDRDDALFAAIGPISDAAIASSNPIDPGAFIDSPRPQRFASARIRRDDRAAVSDREIQDTVDHDRSGFGFVLGSRAEIVGSPDPCNLEVLHVVPINGVDRRISGAAGVAAVNTPFPILRALLRDNGHRQQQRDREKHQQVWLNQLSRHLTSPSSASMSTVAAVYDRRQYSHSRDRRRS